MSIVEKIVGRAGKPARHLKSPVVRSSKVLNNHVATDVESPSSRIGLSNLAERGLISVLEDSELSGAFRFIKRSVLAKIFGPNRAESAAGKVVMVTSALPDAGKSFVAFNLAVSIAQEQLINVVLIDADTVRHHLSTILGMHEAEGLVEGLETGDIDSKAVSTDLPGLKFVPAGQSHRHAAELLASVYMSDALATYEKSDTVVIIDTAPLLVTSEADAMAAHANHTIVVIEAGQTSVDEIESVLHILSKSDSQVNFMLNKLKSISPSGSQYHYYDSY